MSKQGMYGTGYERQPEEWYVEPTWAVEQLIENEDFPYGEIYDPACGMGNIPNTFRRHEFRAYGSDIVDRGWKVSDGFYVSDFLDESYRGNPANIVCNPPYGKARLAEAFIEKALAITVHKVFMFLPLNYLAGQRRYGTFVGGSSRPDTVWICSQRPSCPPGHKLEDAGGGKQDYCWIVWDNQGAGTDTRLKWLPPYKGRVNV